MGIDLSPDVSCSKLVSLQVQNMCISVSPLGYLVEQWLAFLPHSKKAPSLSLDHRLNI